MELRITHAGILPDAIADVVDGLCEYRLYLGEVAETQNEDVPEASILLPADLEVRAQVEKVQQQLETENLKYIFLIGIGGSNLGAKAIYDALYGFSDVIEGEHRPKIIFIDTTDDTLLGSVCTVISRIAELSEYLVITISKSGKTTETMVNTEIILHALIEKFGNDALTRVVGITTKDSAYYSALSEKGIATLSIPECVQGRFSVFSAVGIFPLLSAHIDVDGLLRGALAMREKCLHENFSENYAMQSAIVLFLASKEGKSIHTSFLFNPELESLGKWYRQLLAESIGKKEDKDGVVVHTGITPEVSIGSTALHSMAQLYLGGPPDKMTTFIRTQEDESMRMPKNRLFETIVPEVSGTSVQGVMDAIFEGVTIAYAKNGLSYMEVVLNDISPFELGAFMQFKMFEVMYLGKLLNINPFNQPRVEDFKQETLMLLKNR